MKTVFLLAHRFDYYRNGPKIGFQNLKSILVHIIIWRPYYVACCKMFLDFIYVVIKPQLTVADMPPTSISGKMKPFSVKEQHFEWPFTIRLDNYIGNQLVFSVFN